MRPTQGLICRDMGISSGTFYNWRGKYAGLEANKAKPLKEFETENNKLKRLLADKLLKVEAIQDVLSNKWKRQMVESRLVVIL
jgi:putative transposase